MKKNSFKKLGFVSRETYEISQKNYQMAYAKYKEVYNKNIELQKEIIELKKKIDEMENHKHYKICECCGKQFISKRSDAKYCSPKCKTKANREANKKEE